MLPEVLESMCFKITAVINKDLILMIQNMNYASRILLDELVSDMKLLLFSPATNAIKKRSFHASVLCD